MRTYIAIASGLFEAAAPRLLAEARIDFTADDVQKAVAASEFGVVYFTMTGDGQLHIGEKWHARGDKSDPEYHPDASWRRTVKLTLVPAQKEISVRKGSFGESLRPKLQQALRSLRDAGIIDSTWSLKSQEQASGYQDGKFVRHPNPVDEKGIDALADKALRLSPVTRSLVLYHGTSTIDWARIQKSGLRGLGIGAGVQHGHESRGKHAGNAGVLYLAGSLGKAQDYAELRVASQSKMLGRREHDKYDDNEPAVLRVQVPDPAWLVADDDQVNQIARRISRKLWKAKPPEDRQRICQDLSAKRGFKVNDDIGEMLWRETDDGFGEIFARIPPALFKAWKASLTRDDQVGYKGIIPPKFIERVL